MLRSSVSSSIDVARLSTAVSRPGIDPRVWVTMAQVISEPRIETRKNQQDVFVDIKLMPMGEEETARVGAIYAGNGFGLYCPLHKYDEVLVAAPSGDPDEGLVVIQRLWSPADPPPQAAYDNPDDVTLVVQEGKNLRLNVQGTGNIVLNVDEGKIYLGSPEETEPAIKGQTLKTYLEYVVSTFAAHVHPTSGGPSGPPTAGLPDPPADILATTTEVK